MKIHYGNATINQREFIQTKINQELGVCQSALVCELLDHEGFDGFDYDSIENLYNPETDEPQEIFEWWVIADGMLKDDLIEKGEPVLKNDYGSWWGRTTTGQSVIVDPVFWDIFQDCLSKH